MVSFVFAGQWEFRADRWRGNPVRDDNRGKPNPLFDGIHDPMPVMLMRDDYDRWLDPAMSVDDLRALLKPYDPALMKAFEVSRAVNSVKNDTPECVEPL
jgi:putative SOS response-associated peptidase YedK